MLGDSLWDEIIFGFVVVIGFVFYLQRAPEDFLVIVATTALTPWAIGSALGLLIRAHSLEAARNAACITMWAIGFFVMAYWVGWTIEGGWQSDPSRDTDSLATLGAVAAPVVAYALIYLLQYITWYGLSGFRRERR